MPIAAKRGRLPAVRKTAAGAVAGKTVKPGPRALGAQAMRDGILRAATKVFAKHGYDGGSVEKISSAAKSYDRMIYYYFGSKEGLFIEVLEGIYRHMNEAESHLSLDVGNPVDAIQALVRFVMEYYRKNPHFITLLNTENLHKGRHISKSLRAREYSSPAVELIGKILESGAAQGVFRDDVRARDVYLLIAAMSYFYLSNRYTLSAFLGENLDAPDALVHWQSFITDTVMRTLARPLPASVGKGRTHF